MSYDFIRQSGTAGKLEWSFFASTLTINGEGEMQNYGTLLNNSPWFSYRSKIIAIRIENGVTSLGLNAFTDCINLVNVIIPYSVTEIGEQAFYNCCRLKSITIPGSVTKIGEYAFRDCASLTSVTIPDSMTEIGEAAFQYCDNLTSVIIPGNVTKIGKLAFDGCGNLRDITVGWMMPPLIYDNTFDNVPLTSCVLHVPDGTKESYQAANIWKKFGTIETTQ
jgi:hypothetical protein